MKQPTAVTQSAFDSLLTWLDPDRDLAGRKYETIRQRLIKIFTCRGCSEAEDLADDTINRVTLKAEELAKTYEGDPALYFFGVAQKVHLESLRRKPAVRVLPPIADSEEIEQEYACLERCMDGLPEDQRHLVRRYYEQEKRQKIENRKELASELGIAVNALRIRAHRIRLQLQVCVKGCLDQAPVH